MSAGLRDVSFEFQRCTADYPRRHYNGGAANWPWKAIYGTGNKDWFASYGTDFLGAISLGYLTDNVMVCPNKKGVLETGQYQEGKSYCGPWRWSDWGAWTDAKYMCTKYVAPATGPSGVPCGMWYTLLYQKAPMGPGKTFVLADSSLYGANGVNRKFAHHFAGIDGNVNNGFISAEHSDKGNVGFWDGHVETQEARRMAANWSRPAWKQNITLLMSSSSEPVTLTSLPRGINE